MNAPLRALLARISRLEVAAAGVVAAVMTVLAVLEPDILGAPFASGRTIALVAAGTVAAAAAFVVMVRLGTPAPVRLAVLGLPFVAVSWWLISPFFLDTAVEDDFATSIATAGTTPSDAVEAAPEAAPEKEGESAADTVLLGSGSFTGLAGHDGTGDAGFFSLPDGSIALRLENFDIDNGPDLRLYVVPGADQRSPIDGSLSLGKLRGNQGNQTYALPAAADLTPGDWTVLVWCEAFRVEFVAATVAVA